MKQIKLNKRPNHINEYLTHWTGRKKTAKQSFEILEKIVNSKKLRFSENTNSFPSSKIENKNLMICFTDTPITQSHEHCLRYNYFGISFNKKEMIDHGANPVLYLVDNRQNNQEYLHQFLMQHLFPSNETSLLMSWFSSISQPYDTKILAHKNSAEFYEREWRLNRILPFHWLSTSEASQGKYNEYPFKGKMEREQIGADINRELFYLEFDPIIIENIIVPKSYEKKGQALIKRAGLKCELLVINK